MAEVVGVISGVIGIAGFAQQLAKSVLEIKRFCDDIRYAPEDLLETLEQLSSISDIMMEVRNQESLHTIDGAPATTLKKSLELCERAVRRVCDLATELEKELTQRRLKTAVKIVLRQETFNKMLTRLDRSKDDLSLAYSLYTSACRARESQLLSNQMEEIRAGQLQALSVAQASVSCTATHPTVTKHHERQGPFTQWSEQETQYRIQLPTWMSRRAWEIAFTRGSGSWTASFRNIRAHHWNSRAFRMCREGDLEGIKQLLVQRQLSIHDECDGGGSLVSWATAEGQTETMEYLIARGAKPFWNITYTHNSGPGLRFGIKNSLDGIRSHAKSVLDNFDESNIYCGNKWLCDVQILATDPARLGPAEILRHIYLVSGHAIGWRDGNPEIQPWLHDYISGLEITPQLLHERTSEGMTLLHLLASIFGEIAVSGTIHATLVSFIARAIRAGPELSPRDRSGNTPFITLCIHEWRRCGVPYHYCRAWLAILARAGVDLLEFGRYEHSLLSDCFVFKYGPKVQDWQFLQTNPTDSLVEIFWRSLGPMERTIPGAWIDDSDEREERDYNPLWFPVRSHGIKRQTMRRLKRVLRSQSTPTSYQDQYIDAFRELSQAVAGSAELHRHGVRQTPEIRSYFLSIEEAVSVFGIVEGPSGFHLPSDFTGE